MELEFTLVADGLGFPEGPVAMEDGTLLFVDIEKEGLYRLNPQGEVTRVACLPGGPNGLAIGLDGAAYVCNNGGVYLFGPFHPKPGITWTLPAPNPAHTGGWIERVDLGTTAATVTRLIDNCDGKPLLAPDDIVFDSKGGFYFTDSGKQDSTDSGKQELDMLRKGGVFYVSPDLTVTKLATLATANGVGLSPDEGTLYVSDTIFGRLWALKVPQPDPHAPGALIGIPGTVVQTLPGLQWLDSLKVEAGGNICVGTLLNGGITIFSPDGSFEHIGSTLNDPMVTNLCFGGADMRDVWITASATGTIYKTRWPRPGLRLHGSAASGLGSAAPGLGGG